MAALFTASLSLAADKVNFQLDWLPGGDKSPIYVGIDQGFFAEVDIEVRINQGRGSTEAITRIATGTSDIGIADIVALLQARAADNVPVKAVYSLLSQAPHAFVVKKEAGIQSVADVKGKKVATSPFTSSNIFLPLLLEKNGLKESDITLVKTDPGALGPMLITDATDVVISWLTSVDRYRSQAKQAGTELDVIPWYDAGLEFYATSVIASERFLKERPDVAKRFLSAFHKSVEFAFANPDMAAKAVNKKVPEADIPTAITTINSMRTLVYNSVSEKDGIGTITPERLQLTWQATAKAQNLNVTDFDPESVVDRRFYMEQ
ncbi:ABC transporter substrate-binding protein [Marinomonas agarivorans]|nr:ABC transporter substrate-binding protein [Marinomonas agarivorans]